MTPTAVPACRGAPHDLDYGMSSPRVGILMGSDSDWPIMEAAAQALAEFDIGCEVKVSSAHRMPHATLEYGQTAAARGLQVIIAGAGPVGLLLACELRLAALGNAR